MGVKIGIRFSTSTKIQVALTSPWRQTIQESCTQECGHLEEDHGVSMTVGKIQQFTRPLMEVRHGKK